MSGHVSESLYSLKLLLPQHVFLTNKIKHNYLKIGLLMYYNDKKTYSSYLRFRPRFLWTWNVSSHAENDKRLS